MIHRRLPLEQRAALAIAIFLLAFGLRWAVLPVDGGVAFLTFYPSLLITFYLCGRAGWLTALPAAFVGYYLFLPPYWSLAPSEASLLSTAAFLTMAAMCNYVIGRLQEAGERLRAAADEIRISQARYRSVLDEQSDWIVRFGADGTVAYANPAICRAFGVTVDGILGRRWAPPVVAEDQERITRELAGLSIDNPVVSIQKRVISVDGVLWAQFVDRANFDGQGHLLDVLKVGRDISALKRAEEALAQSERWLRKVADNTPVAVVYVDREERYRFVNAHYQTMYGIGSGQMLGRTIREVFGDDYYPRVCGPVQAALRGESQRFERHVTERGLDLYVLADFEPDFDAGGVVAGIFVSITDVTARKQAELRRQESEEKLRIIADGVPGLILYLDLERRVRFSNALFEDWFGIPSQQTEGRKIQELIDESLVAAVHQPMEQAFAGARSDTELEFTANGQHRHVHSSFIPYRDKSGEVVGIYSLSTDISKLKQVQQQLTLMARTDVLTGLSNRGDFNQRLQEAIGRATRSGQALGLMFVDADYFKSINDRHGHGAGDAVLQEIAVRLQGCIRRTDLVARYAGDEFVVLIENPVDGRELEIVAGKILASVNRPIRYRDVELVIGLSIGIVRARGRDLVASELLMAADRALYQAKDAGRNTCRIADIG